MKYHGATIQSTVRSMLLLLGCALIGGTLRVGSRSTLPFMVNAVPIAENFVVGQWDIQVSGGGILGPVLGWNSANVFPAMMNEDPADGRNVEQHEDEYETQNNGSSSNSSNGFSLFQNIKRRLPQFRQNNPRTVTCSLNLHRDGSFIIAPKSCQQTTAPLMPIRGQWKIQSNTHCITDRFYDQLILNSYPRIEKEANKNNILQQIQFEFHCRVWGRYGSSSSTTNNGRLSHGTVLWKNDDTKNERKMPSSYFRPIVASFSGAFQCPNELDEQDDEIIFGY
eukprot:CAMPEP_0119549312 /NCGR_PEP_ID=MMETSP1352-20130426/3053_1 /TAXON_ID=265584 /ORGANISM="Stauroneis constricta, Strain CCMP1120" /LENGTH=279 /DNA_ID=CAMNT_0007594845 /DNA_START=51 /DNA_END=890 /DNA_ORIENTATION=-